MAERGGVSSKVSPARQQGKLWESCKAPPAPPFDPHSHSNIGREGLAVPTYRGRSENSRSPGQGCLEGQREPVSPPLLISPLSPAQSFPWGEGASGASFLTPRGASWLPHTFQDVLTFTLSWQAMPPSRGGNRRVEKPHLPRRFLPLVPIGMFWPLLTCVYFL